MKTPNEAMGFHDFL